MSCANMNKNGAEGKTIILRDKENVRTNSVQKNSSTFQDDEDANEDSEELFSDDAADNTVCYTPVGFDTPNKDISFLTSLKTPVLYSIDQSKTPSAALIPSAPLSLVPFLSHINESWTSDLETPECKRNIPSVQGSPERIIKSVDSAEKEPCSVQLTPAESIRRNVEPEYISTSPILNNKRIRRRPKRRIFKPSPSKSLLNQRINSKTLEANDQTSASNDFVTSHNTVTLASTTSFNTNCYNDKKYATSPKQDSTVSQEVPICVDNKNTEIKTTEQFNTSTQEFFANTSFSAIDKICEDVNIQEEEPSKKSVEDRIKAIKQLQKPRRQILEHEYVAISADDLTRDVKLLESAAAHPVVVKNERRPHNQLGLIPFSQLCPTETGKSTCIPDTNENEKKVLDPETNQNVNIEDTTSNKMNHLNSTIRESLNNSEVSETCSKNISASLSLEEDNEEMDDIFREVENEVTDTQMENLGEMAMAFAEDFEEFNDWEYKSNEVGGTSVRETKIKEMENTISKNEYKKSNGATIEKSDVIIDKPLCGFLTASGKNININQERISAAMKLFENIEESSTGIGDLNLVSKIGKTATSGFSTASGKSISVSEDKLRLAEKIYDDIDINSCLEVENGKSHVSNVKQQRSWPMLNKKTHVTNLSDPLAQSKTSVKLSKNEILRLKRKCDFKDDNLTEPSNLMPCRGFATAAGKSLAVSENALKKAKCIFRNEDLTKVFVLDNNEVPATQVSSHNQINKEELDTVKVKTMVQGLFHGFSSLELTFSEFLATKLKALLQIEESLKLSIEFDNEDINDDSDSINFRPFYGFSSADFVKSQCCAYREKLRVQKEDNKVNDNLVRGIIKLNDPTNVITNLPEKSTVSTEHHFIKPRVTVKLASSSTANNKKMNIIPKAMLKVRPSLLTEDVIDKENKVRNNQRTRKLSLGFSTASDRPVTISKDALSNPKLLLSESNENIPRNEVADELKKNNSNMKQSENRSMAFGFSTAGGRAVNVSEEALSKAKALFENVESTITKDLFQEHLSEMKDYETDVKKPMTLGFSTAGGRPVKVSEQALSKSKAIFENLESTVTKDLFQEHLSEMKDYETDVKKPMTLGFSTAGGRPVKVSEQALSKSKAIFENLESTVTKDLFQEHLSEMKDYETDVKKPMTLGFSTAGGRPVKVSEQALSKSKAIFENLESTVTKDLFQDHLSEMKDYETDAKKLMTLGFSTAGGRPVKVSEQALSKSKAIFENLESTVTKDLFQDHLSEMKDYETDAKKLMTLGFSTAGGRPVKVSEQALSKSKAIFENLESTVTKDLFQDHLSEMKDYETDAKKLMTLGFSTAGGRPVKVSEQALSKSKAIFENLESTVTNDVLQEQLSEMRDYETDVKKPMTFGFSTAGGRSVKISEESLSKAKTSFSCELSDTPNGSSSIKNENCSSTPGNFILRNKSVSSRFKPIIKRKASEVDEDTPSGRLHLLKLKRPRLSNEFQARKLFSDVSDRKIEINKMQEDKCKPVANQEDIKENDRTMSPKWQPQKSFPIISTKINTDMIDIDNPTLEKGQILKKTLIFDEVEASTAALLEDEENSKDSTFWASKFEPKPIDVEVPGKDSIPVSRKTYENPTTPIASSTSPVLSDLDKFVSRKRRIRRSLNTSLLKENCDSPKSSFKVPYKDKSTELFIRSISNHKVPYNIGNGSRCTNSPVTHEESKLEHSIYNTEVPKRYKSVNQDVSTNEFVNIIEKRLSASLEQERLIRMKKRNKPKPMKGNLLSSRESNKKCRISWRQITEGKPLVPRSVQELIDARISTDILGITANTAEEYKFQCIDYYPEDLIRENIDGFKVGDDARLIMNNTESVGTLEFVRSFESSPGVDPALIPPGWIENHYRWIVWKLASMDRMKFGSISMPRMLTPNRVMFELKYRYDREIDRSERSALRRILEKDDSACKRMVLCVASVTECKEHLNTLNSPKNAGSSQWKLVLTDGWYSIPAAIDIAMTNYVSSGKVQEGTKLVTYGAELLNSDQGCFPLEVPADVCLRIHTNSTRRARWDVKLGYQSHSGPITTSLKTISPNGGLIGKMIVTVIRVYPILYREKMADGQSIFRNARCEEKAAMAFEQGCQSKAEVIYAKARADLENGSQSEEQEHFMEQRRAMEEEIKQEVEAKLRECLPAPRQVTPLLRIRVADDDRTAILTMWSGAEEAGNILKEGSIICLHNIFASGKRAGDLQLTAGRNTVFNKISNQKNSIPSRKFTSLSEIAVPGFNPDFGEFDTVGIVSSVGNAPHGMKNFETANLAYPDPDTSTSSYLSVLFWQGISSHGYSEILSVGSVVSCSNLEWRRSSSWSVPVAYCTERTVFTRNPRQSHLRQPFDDLTSRVKEPMAYAATCALEIASETMKKTIGTRTPGQGTPNKLNQDIKRTPVYSPRIAIDSPSPSMITPVKSSITKRLEKLQWYGEPPELSPMVIHNSSSRVVQEFRPPVRTPDKP
ncbi:breast cancer type 2 susceptibility protein homolog [Cephus cinctus]|uniref:Breast cancer type 2 susceptibility protein homolog n=1 Tax=Cephus cinctus TaxID=211228 RepID=A0AAJ7BZM5_CEPCN|nr:breast cancer type 2 susceptibility protein homolog [Cephus cinctus]